MKRMWIKTIVIFSGTVCKCSDSIYYDTGHSTDLDLWIEHCIFKSPATERNQDICVSIANNNSLNRWTPLK